MIQLRKARERGHADHGWLNTYHTFSFADYYDPKHMGFRTLRVINEDRVNPGEGFPTHGHRDMEILSYVIEGALAHKDSMGNGTVIRAGEVQRMSAGLGVQHSEFNHSRTEGVHFLQIWILPEKRGLKPGYEQRLIPREEKLNRLRLIASRDGREQSLKVAQDVELYASVLEEGRNVDLPLGPARHAWVQVVRGSVDLNGNVLAAGDGAALSAENAVRIVGVQEAEVLVFDLG